MRHVFHPGWGCLAPAPSLIHTLRIAVIATAVGATAGGSVVLSLVDRSAGERSIVERTLVRPGQVGLPPLSKPRTAQLTLQPLSEKASVSQSGAEAPHASGSNTNSITLGPSVTLGEAEAPHVSGSNTNSMTLGPSVTLGEAEDYVATDPSTNSITPGPETTGAVSAAARSTDYKSARAAAVQLPARKMRHVSEQTARHDRTANLSQAHDPADGNAPDAVQRLLARLAGALAPPGIR
jgi:hypothetical protein